MHSEETILLDKSSNIILSLPFLYTPTETITIKLPENTEPQKYDVKWMVDELSKITSADGKYANTIIIRKIFIE